jgi:hypothetical protein
MRSTPEEAFAVAQASIARRDWCGFFACFDRGDLCRAAEDFIPVYFSVFGRDDWFLAHCEAHGLLLDALDAWEQRRRALERAGVPGRRRPNGATMMGERPHFGLSERQRALVDETARAMRVALAPVRNPDEFVGGLVARVQGVGRTSAIPSTLFLGETLEEVVVQGDRARATRTVRGAAVAELEFVRRRGEWVVHLA